MKKFVCDRCGACCQQLPLFGSAYAFLDDGTGVCRYYDAGKKICRIYPIRPLICRIIDSYREYYSAIPYEQYIEMTKYACILLKNKLNKKEL